jgi:hypothetical protein
MNNALLLILIVAWIWHFFGRQRNCSQCGAGLPRFIWPQTKTARQWWEGGCKCPKCGVDVDSEGKLVERGAIPVSWSRIVARLSPIVVLAGIGVGLTWVLLQKKTVVLAVPAEGEAALPVQPVER